VLELPFFVEFYTIPAEPSSLSISVVVLCIAPRRARRRDAAAVHGAGYECSAALQGGIFALSLGALLRPCIKDPGIRTSTNPPRDTSSRQCV